MSILDSIDGPEALRRLSSEELTELCGELRKYIVENVARTGGHLASNLGVVELSVALECVFDLKNDRLVFDVGHQSYVHKILTGRKEAFSTLRQIDGISGFPDPEESEYDAFVAGHASNSVSVALGMARARTLLGQDYNVIALIGDGALTGGLSYEALSNAGQSGEKLLVILNDNGMSIAKNVGGIAQYLSHKRVNPSYYAMKKGYARVMNAIPGGKHIYNFTHKVKSLLKIAILHCSVFEELGFQYFGPIDGHDIEKVSYFLECAKQVEGPVLLHVVTQKGKGYSYSEQTPDEYHGVSRFDPDVGLPHGMKDSFSAMFGTAMNDFAERSPKVCAIAAAMHQGVGLESFFKKYPERSFDAGIAEGHATAMAAGMARQGLVPVFAVYSTFLQRAYDMLIHDVALMGLHVVFAVDRAGIVGEDGKTHQGVFDPCFLRTVPGMTVLCPASYRELYSCLEYAVFNMNSPVAVRYPRGGQGVYQEDNGMENVQLRSGSDITLISYGININDAIGACELLEKRGISAGLIKLGKIAPLDLGFADKLCKKAVIIEECAEKGCVGQEIADHICCNALPVQLMKINLGKGIVPHGAPAKLRERFGLDAASVADAAERFLREGSAASEKTAS